MHESLFDTIEQPTLLLDEETARQNIRRVIQAAGAIRLRPHFKTHQSAEIGTWFRDEGVTRITVSSVEMARYFAAHGWEDITIAFPANVRQAAAIAALAGTVQLGLLAESVETVRALARAGVRPAALWLKVDTGAHRTGLLWDDPTKAGRVAEAARAEGFPLRGLLAHAGNTYGAVGADEVCRRYRESVDRLDGLRRALDAAGYGPLQISVGDTPSASLCADLTPADELRPGNFVFYDAKQMQVGACGWQDVAVALACPVVALHPERGEVVLYGGAIHFSTDFFMEGEQRVYGRVCLPHGERWGAPVPGAALAALSQEHGILRFQAEAASALRALRPGDLVCVLPAHSCLTVTQMKYYRTLTGRRISTMNE
jgi:D-serine deaminase-like pyridoxal phosphate-dependent protein